jgi:hypothetical protein
MECVLCTLAWMKASMVLVCPLVVGFVTRLRVLEHRTRSQIKLVVDTYSADDVAGVVKCLFSSDSVIIKVKPNNTKQFTLIPQNVRKEIRNILTSE